MNPVLIETLFLLRKHGNLHVPNIEVCSCCIPNHPSSSSHKKARLHCTWLATEQPKNFMGFLISKVDKLLQDPDLAPVYISDPREGVRYLAESILRGRIKHQECKEAYQAYYSYDPSRYFQNKACGYFPCHKHNDQNCFFCFCPLYPYDCKGNFKIKKGIKDCSNCIIPHQPGIGYNMIIKALKTFMKVKK